MIDLLHVPDFLGADTRRDVLAVLRGLGGSAATVLDVSAAGAVRQGVRRTTRLPAPAELVRSVHEALRLRKEALEDHFGIALAECEEPQFLRYGEGDFFVPHQDGNTPLIMDRSRFRRISAVAFLNAQAADPSPGTYGGGDLVFHGPYTGPEVRVPVAPPPGTLVAFRAETTHEVTPVTHGERYTVVSWFR